MAGLDHISSGNTTLCYCWVVVRIDGVTIGFTDHDNDVTVDGVTCLSTTGMTTTKITKMLGLSPGDLEVDGAIDDEALTDEDLAAGLYDYASVKVYLVDWGDPTRFRLMASGEFGNVNVTESGGFTVQFLSNTNRLGQKFGRVFQRTCDTKLGSPACGVDTTDPAYQLTSTVVSVVGATVIINGADGFADGWFSLGRLTLENGAELGIRDHIGTAIYLWQRPALTIGIASTVILTAGCKQDAATCRTKFNNILRFQGFPFIPGTDALTSYPIRGTRDYTGGSLFQ